MPDALFDPIINSEDEMLIRAGLQERKYHAATYLRAYIMASLCFEQKLVVTDTAAILNKAFRTLIDKREGVGYNQDFLPEAADFDWLIQEGHIEFAARDDRVGNFSDLSEEFRLKKKNVDLPSEEYARKLDEIYYGKRIHEYNINEATKKFTFKFRDQVKKKLEDINTYPEITKTLRDLTYILSDKETLDYNSVKNTMKDKLGLEEKNPQYQYVRGILRQSYDYNIPELLGLDYCRSLQGIKPSCKRDWKLELDREKTLEFDFDCSIYGLAALPTRNLLDIWGSDPGEEFAKQLRSFRAGAIEIDEYVESLRRYILKINDEVRRYYDAKHSDFYEKGKLARLKIRARQYFYSDSPCIVMTKMLKDTYNTIADIWDVYDMCDISDIRNISNVRHMFDWRSPIIKGIANKVIPNVAKIIDGFPDPPEEMNEAVIMKSKTESGSV